MLYQFTTELKNNGECIAEFDCRAVIDIHYGQIDVVDVEVYTYGERTEDGQKKEWAEADPIILRLATEWLKGQGYQDAREAWDDHYNKYIDYAEAV